MSYRHDPRIRQYESFDQFHGCARRDLRSLVRVSTRIDVPAGKVLARQGRNRNGFVVLISGGADVLRDGHIVDHLGTGDHFGEFALVRSVPEPATIVATEASVVDVISVREFRGAYNAMAAFRATIDEALDRRTATWLTVPTAPVLSSTVAGLA